MGDVVSSENLEQHGCHTPVDLSKLPQSVKIAGIPYKIKYCQTPSEVDIYKRESLWGQCDYWTKTFRVYAKDNPMQMIVTTLLHEIVHGYGYEMDIPCISPRGVNTPEETEEMEFMVDRISRMLFDFLVANPWTMSIHKDLKDYDEKNSCNISEGQE